MESAEIGVIGGSVLGVLLLAGMVTALLFPAGGPGPQPDGSVLTGESISISLHEWGFNEFQTGGPTIEMKAGTEVTFTVSNEGFNFHNWQVITQDGQERAGWSKEDPLNPGETRTITVTLEELGEFFYLCSVSGHREKGMISILRVVP